MIIKATRKWLLINRCLFSHIELTFKGMFCRTINHGISPRVSVSKLYKRIIAVGIMLANQIRSVWMFSAKLVTVSCKPALIIQTYYTVGVLDKSYGTIMI
jgi:hypothetical protein